MSPDPLLPGPDSGKGIEAAERSEECAEGRLVLSRANLEIGVWSVNA